MKNRSRHDNPALSIVIACARRDMQPEHIKTVSKFASGVDWEQVSQAAHAHGVVPLVYYHLLETCSATLPPGIETNWRQILKATKVFGNFLRSEVAQLYDRLQQSEVRCVFFKGVALEELNCKQTGLRRTFDVDVLAKLPAISNVEAVLNELGYELVKPAWSALRTRIYRYVLGERHYVRGKGTFMVDLHDRLISRHYRFGLSFDELYDAAIPISINGLEIKTLGVEDTLIMLSINGFKNGRWSQIRYLVDIVDLLNARPEIEKDKLLSRAKAAGCTEMVVLALRLAQEILRVKLPHQLEKSLPRLQTVESMADVIMHRLWKKSWEENMTWRDRLLLQPLRLQNTIERKMQYISVSLLQKVHRVLP